MNSHGRRLLLPFILLPALVALAAPVALASPDGDDDSTYNPGNAFGTAYSLVRADDDENTYLRGARPATDQAPDGSSVTANLMARRSSGSRIIVAPSPNYLRLTRFDSAGRPTGFGGDGVSDQDLDTDLGYKEVLDLRVLGNGQIVVLLRGYRGSDYSDEQLHIVRYDADGQEIADATHQVPDSCVEDAEEGTDRVTIQQGDLVAYGTLAAARANADSSISALWDCKLKQDASEDPVRAGRLAYRNHRIVVAQYDDEYAEVDASTTDIPGDYPMDLELGPDGDPFALVGVRARAERGVASPTSEVYRVDRNGDDLGAVTPNDVAFDLEGAPVDLAVDSQSRPVVWTGESATTRGGYAAGPWSIWRETAQLNALDTSWGTAGKTVVSDPRLGEAETDPDGDKREFLTIRPGDKVLALGRYQSQDEGDNRQLDVSVNGIVAGLTASGQRDTGFASAGFKVFEYDDQHIFARIGEPTLQADGKVLVPHTHFENFDRSAQRIAAPPGDGQFVGVTRLVAVDPTAGTTGGGRPVLPSSVPAVCGRRAISLVRADVRGRKVKLTGLVGAALYGKKVAIQTDPKGAKSSKFNRTMTVRASRTGSFTASVPRPRRADYVTVRYRAVSGRAKSPALKLPQSLTSRSVKSAAGTITVKGRVKTSLLGKRNRVKIRRLVCGRYRTVGSAKPDANGNYTVKFNATQIRGAAFYRAESRVLRKPGSKKYVTQYARAIAIRTTSQTG